MYTHRTTHGKHISFHDCTLSKLKCKEGKVVFKFKDGINALGERTKKAKVKLKLTPMETPVCYVYDVKKNKTVRKEWTLEKLKDKLEYGGYALEFVECYEWKFGKTVHRIYCCSLHSDQKPYLLECELRLSADKTVYKWQGE